MFLCHKFYNCHHADKKRCKIQNERKWQLRLCFWCWDVVFNTSTKGRNSIMEVRRKRKSLCCTSFLTDFTTLRSTEHCLMGQRLGDGFKDLIKSNILQGQSLHPTNYIIKCHPCIIFNEMASLYHFQYDIPCHFH